MISKSREQSLFVFGNGFDLAHGYHTKYCDFKKWLMATLNGNRLVEEIEDVLGQLRGGLPEFIDSLPNADDYYESDNWLWSNLENALSSIPDAYENMIEKAQVCFDDRKQELYDHDPEMADNVENDPAEQDSVRSTLDIPELDKTINGLYSELDEWIDSVDLRIRASSFTKKWSRPFQQGDKALTFNYTHTLEKIYGIPYSQILHIHGEAGNDNNRIILGHDIDLSSVVFDESDESAAWRIVDGILGYSTSKTAKPTELIIEQNECWFDSLKRVDNVLVYGHSLSEVDLPYFLRLMEATHSTSWCIYAHDSAKVPLCLLEKARDEKIQLDEKDDKEFWNRS